MICAFIVIKLQNMAYSCIKFSLNLNEGIQTISAYLPLPNAGFQMTATPIWHNVLPEIRYLEAIWIEKPRIHSWRCTIIIDRVGWVIWTRSYQIFGCILIRSSVQFVLLDCFQITKKYFYQLIFYHNLICAKAICPKVDWNQVVLHKNHHIDYVIWLPWN